MGNSTNWAGKVVFVTGGSTGLGKEIAKAVAAKGAHVTIFARRQGVLDDAKSVILASRLSSDQKVKTVSVDLTDASKVEAAFKAQYEPADILYCCAGGCTYQQGFFVDLQPDQLEICMQSNYLTAAYSAQVILKLWVADDQKDLPHGPRHRRIIFINSAAAFIGLPGVIAYNTAKSAVRALADTLRMEVLKYNTANSSYSIHSAHPSTFITDNLLEEVSLKPILTRIMEKTNMPINELSNHYPSAERVAALIVQGVERDDFALCDDSLDASIAFANSIGCSPKRGLGIIDSLLQVGMGWVVWPVYRRYLEGLCRKDNACVDVNGKATTQ